MAKVSRLSVQIIIPESRRETKYGSRRTLDFFGFFLKRLQQNHSKYWKTKKIYSWISFFQNIQFLFFSFFWSGHQYEFSRYGTPRPLPPEKTLNSDTRFDMMMQCNLKIRILTLSINILHWKLRTIRKYSSQR